MQSFRIVDPPSYGWTADPFVVKYRNEIYLFAEIFLYLSERNGVIGYCKFDGERFGEWKVSMDRHWHLSYPYVFEEDNALYMIPESYQLGEVNLYKLIEFPDRWEKVKTLIMNVEYCDSTIMEYKDGNKYMFTFERGKQSPNGKGWLYRMNHDCFSESIFLSDDLDGTRCAGKILSHNNRFIRVGQDCKTEYGSGIVFYEIDSVWPDYSEHEIKRLYSDDINVVSEKRYCGIHTYNKLESIEVIDLKYHSSTFEENHASDRVKEVFGGKYGK